MKSAGDKLIIRQLDKKIQPFLLLKDVAVPAGGWVKTIRTAINMSLRQLGNKLFITPQSVKRIEDREAEGNVTLHTLREVAEALDMQLVYAFIPKDGSIEQMIARNASKMAHKIVLRAHTTMELEDQGTGGEDVKLAIRELTEELKREMPRSLWD